MRTLANGLWNVYAFFWKPVQSCHSSICLSTRLVYHFFNSLIMPLGFNFFRIQRHFVFVFVNSYTRGQKHVKYKYFYLIFLQVTTMKTHYCGKGNNYIGINIWVHLNQINKLFNEVNYTNNFVKSMMQFLV